MGIKQIATDTVIMQNDITALEEALGIIKTKMENMFTNMKVLDGMWSGTANMLFMMQFNKDYSTLKEICDTLTSLIESIKAAKVEYEKCESSINTVIKSIKIEEL